LIAEIAAPVSFSPEAFLSRQSFFRRGIFYLYEESALFTSLNPPGHATFGEIVKVQVRTFFHPSFRIIYHQDNSFYLFELFSGLPFDAVPLLSRTAQLWKCTVLPSSLRRLL